MTGKKEAVDLSAATDSSTSPDEPRCSIDPINTVSSLSLLRPSLEASSQVTLSLSFTRFLLPEDLSLRFSVSHILQS